jgi:hypothetical protein
MMNGRNTTSRVMNQHAPNLDIVKQEKATTFT